MIFLADKELPINPSKLRIGRGRLDEFSAVIIIIDEMLFGGAAEILFENKVVAEVVGEILLTDC